MDILKELKINVNTSFIADKSSVEKSFYFFMYKVKIFNQSVKTVQLLERHWNIYDANGNMRTVIGEGVIGQKPVLKPGVFFEYKSFCPIKTEFGKMKGFYTFKDKKTNKLFKTVIPEFSFVAPNFIN